MFQRPYVWNKDDQWAPLWEDIRTLSERILENSSLGQPQVPPHFLGAIVLDEQHVPTAYIPIRHVIDGQQRLTTLQIVLDAAQLVVNTHGNAADAIALRNLIQNNSGMAEDPDEAFKVWPTNYDRDAFRAVMDDERTPTAEQASSSKIAQCHEFFEKVIKEWALEEDPEDAPQRLRCLATALMQYLRLVVIDLQPGDNAQVIFETLNHRGTPLLAADLVKNLVFQTAQADGLDLEALYASHWQDLDASSWRRTVKQGRLHRPRIDVFLNYWLVMRRAREVPTDRVFADFRDYFLNGNRPVLEVVGDLSANGKTYDGLEGMPADSAEGTFYYRILHVMEQFVLGPLVLWLFSWNEEELPRTQRQKALAALESWSVRRMLCRMTGKQINRLLLEILGALDPSRIALAGDDIEAFLLNQNADSTLWPSDDEVLKALATLPLYKTISRSRLRMVLEALEDHCRTGYGELGMCPRGQLTIEHILPQKWNEHWPLPDGDSAVLTSARDRSVHILGNLTLITGKLNSLESNLPWDDETCVAKALNRGKGKRSLLFKHSNLSLNKDVVGLDATHFDEEAIDERGRVLANAVLAIWPRGRSFT